MTAPLVFITGASSGIGQALAARYLRAGWRLALVARRTHEIKSWADALGLSADSYEIYGADVSQPDSIIAAGQACLARQLRQREGAVFSCKPWSVGLDCAGGAGNAIVAGNIRHRLRPLAQGLFANGLFRM